MDSLSIGYQRFGRINRKGTKSVMSRFYFLRLSCELLRGSFEGLVENFRSTGLASRAADILGFSSIIHAGFLV